MKYDDGSYESAYIGHFERQHTLSSWFENLLNFLDTNEIQVGNKDIQLDIPKSHVRREVCKLLRATRVEVSLSTDRCVCVCV